MSQLAVFALLFDKCMCASPCYKCYTKYGKYQIKQCPGGLPYSAENARVLHKAILWSCSKDNTLYDWYSENPETEIHVYPGSKQYAVVNNTGKPQDTTVYAAGKIFPLSLKEGELVWYEY